MYTITTTTPSYKTTRSRDDQMRESAAPAYVPEVTRCAVATLEEARTEAITTMAELSRDAPDVDAVNALNETGGTIALPDGTVIEITFRTWLEALRLTNIVLVGQYPSESEKRLILDALSS